MNNIKQIELYKSRSYTACITEAMGIFAHNIKTIFLHTWAYAVAVGVASSLYASAVTDIMANAATTGNMVLLACASVLSVCTTVALYGRAATLINQQKTAWSIKRTARITLIALAFGLIVGIGLGVVAAAIAPAEPAAKQPEAFSTESICVNVAVLLISLLVLPYVYAFAKYMMEPDTKLLRMLTRSYKTGLRHWGFIFTTSFLTYLCMAVCAVILALPTVIIISARVMSISGMATVGDPSGLPPYFDAMQFGLFAIAAFIWAYISIFCAFVYFLIYGSIETREKEKKAFLGDMQNQEPKDTANEK